RGTKPSSARSTRTSRSRASRAIFFFSATTRGASSASRREKSGLRTRTGCRPRFRSGSASRRGAAASSPRPCRNCEKRSFAASPMFDNRWRWNASRALALLRFAGGKKVPVALQRMRAEDLLGAVFPEQLMCGDNRAGPIEPPDHPLVETTIYDCLHEALDLSGLKEIIVALEAGELKTISVDTPAPSPMAHEILNANPYAFLDDAPLEE